MLEDEKTRKARYAKEVTADYQSVVTEHRIDCLDEVLRLFEPPGKKT